MKKLLAPLAALTALLLAPAVRAGTCSNADMCAAVEHHSASDGRKCLLVDSSGTPYTASGGGGGGGGTVDQGAEGTAADAWYVRQAPGGAAMSASNPLIVQLTDGSAVYNAPAAAQLPAALVSGRLAVDGSAVTQPVSAASLPLPTGAATSARQAAPGTAGTPSSEVLSTQGVVGGTPLAIVEGGTSAYGNGTSISCDTTPVVVDDSSLANTAARDVEVCNPSTNVASIYLGGSGVGANGREVMPSACYTRRLAANSTPLYCYAASAVSASVVESN